MKFSHDECVSGLNDGRDQQKWPPREQKFGCDVSLFTSTGKLVQMEGGSVHHSEKPDEPEPMGID